jgi:hypothetical protein
MERRTSTAILIPVGRIHLTGNSLVRCSPFAASTELLCGPRRVAGVRAKGAAECGNQETCSR